MQAVMATPNPQPALQPDVEIRQRQDAAQQRAHEHGPPGQLEHAVAAAGVDLLEPLPLDLLGRPLKTFHRQFKIVFGTCVGRRTVARAARWTSWLDSLGRVETVAGRAACGPYRCGGQCSRRQSC